MKKLIIIILLLAVAGAAYWFFFFDKKTEEELIREQLDGLVSACSKKGKESAISVVMNNSEISNYIASTCSVSIAQMMMNGTYTPMEFAASLSKSRLFFKSLKGSTYDVEIRLTNDTTATVDYSVRIVGKRKNGDAFDDSRDLRSEIVKEEDKWKFAGFEIREVLEK